MILYLHHNSRALNQIERHQKTKEKIKSFLASLPTLGV